MSVVGVVRLVVHDEDVVHEVEAVGPGLEGELNHLVHELLLKAGELVNVLAGVAAAGDAEAKVKVECLQVSVPEEVALNHSKVLKGTK